MSISDELLFGTTDGSGALDGFLVDIPGAKRGQMKMFGTACMEEDALRRPGYGVRRFN